MRYAAVAEGQASWVEVHATDPEQYAITIDGEAGSWRARRAAGNVWMLVDGEGGDVHELAVIAAGGGQQRVLAVGWAADVDVMTARELGQRRPQGAARAGQQAVRVPMPGRLVALLVGEGDQVVRGQPLAVVEAMKMENELRAPGDGAVRGLIARPGEAVEGGAVLCTLELGQG